MAGYLSQDDAERCKSLQDEEWEVLESIYPDFVSRTSEGLIKLDIHVDFGESRSIRVVDDGTISSAVAKTYEGEDPGPSQPCGTLSLQSLPPVLLTILLPEDYPLRNAPRLLSVHATSNWLPRLSHLQQKLTAMYNAPDPILFEWIEWIHSADFLQALGLLAPDGTVSIPNPAPHLLTPLLAHHDAVAQATRFSENAYECGVCLSSVKGARCIMLACAHVFCRGCLEDFWKLCVAEGDVSRVGCPDPQCVKKGNAAGEEDVRRVLTDEEVQRWRWLKQKQLLEKDPTIIHCPVSVCQTPVPGPKGETEGSGWERLRTCSNCNYSFCAYCRRTWHGPISECALSMADTFLAEYLNAGEGSRKRQEIEQRYGKANVLKLVVKYKEDQANREWLEASTMSCPTCRVHVEKSHGCNHMTCGKCKTHFCYRCGEKLLASNPYVHFSTAGKRCYSKLFDFQSEEDDGWEAVDIVNIALDGL